MTRPAKAYITPSQQTILKLMWEGLNSKEIARQLRISHKTVEAQRREMFLRLNVRSAIQAVRAAIDLGFLKAKTG